MRENTFTPFVFLLSIIFLTGCISCKKQLDGSSLPPITQTGANTFGFLLNGQLWTPDPDKGLIYTPHLKIGVNFSTNGYFSAFNGFFTISASKNVGNYGQTISISSSNLNAITTPYTYKLSDTSRYEIDFADHNDLVANGCQFISHFTNYQTGSLTITRLDTLNKIISGTFNAAMYQVECGDTVKITDGRFDMKF
jgi:hypothetical protein